VNLETDKRFVRVFLLEFSRKIFVKNGFHPPRPQQKISRFLPFFRKNEEKKKVIGVPSR